MLETAPARSVAVASSSPHEVLTTAEATESMDARHTTLEAWRTRGQGPRFSKVGGTVSSAPPTEERAAQHADALDASIEEVLRRRPRLSEDQRAELGRLLTPA